MDADIAQVAKSVGLALEQAGVDYAIGGALALGIHGALRATRDVDVNVFCEPSQWPRAVSALVSAGVKVDEPAALREAASEGWFTGWVAQRISQTWSNSS